MNIEHGVWICHRGCGSGDFTNLVMVVLGCSIGEAYEWVHSNGRASSVEQLSRSFAQAIGQPLGQSSEPSNDHWKTHYLNLNSNIMPLWFLERGFTWPTINEWSIKYDPPMDAVVVPVYWEDELVGSVTRNTREGYPKYQNSPDLPRASILFGKINPNAKRIYLVEGLLDCVWAWQCGFNAVSLLGTTLSNQQILILRKYRFGNITLAFDNDDAGKKATEINVQRLQDGGWLLPQIQIVTWPKGIKDANECEPELLNELFTNTRGVYA